MKSSIANRQSPIFGLLRAELKESFNMAMGALAAHKLRSALTLLGVLVGVFSIIVVMTAMRVMQSNIEAELSQLGSNTFQVRKWPGAFFGVHDFEKYWRRKNITWQHGLQVQERATLALNVGLESYFWGGVALSRFDKTPPTTRLLGETPGSFPARNWIVGEGRAIMETDVESARD
ncbi:MAG: ABC transporter permease, partial [Verrucomicrobia bacterium]|nr:ABC transporter permease [Verrucomicrobiota bacterium]